MGETMLINTSEQWPGLCNYNDEDGVEIDSSVLSWSEEERQRLEEFSKAVDEEEGYESRVVFPWKFVTEVCSCLDCRPKILELKDFEQYLQSKKNLVQEYLFQEQNIRDRCLDFSMCTHWTRTVLVLLHCKLKSVHEDSGVAWPAQKIESATKFIKDKELQIAKLLMGWYSWVNDHEDDIALAPDADLVKNIHVIPFERLISSGVRHYKCTRNTELKDKAHKLLKEMLEIEEKHGYEITKSAKAMGRPLALSISEGYIEEQIKLVNQLPVEELYHEHLELINQISPIVEYTDMVDAALADINRTFNAILQISVDFWQSGKGRGKEHIPKKTFESLS